MNGPIRVAITTGDINGIGSEIVSKALVKLRPQKGVRFYLWRSPRCPQRDLRRIDSTFRRITVLSWPEALRVSDFSYKEIVDIKSSLPPAKWVELMAHAAKMRYVDAIATAPLSKTAIHKAKMKDIGHTEILKRVSGGPKTLHMAFVGKKFNVLLATGHAPVEEAVTQLTASRLRSAVEAAHDLKKLLPRSKNQKPLALVGLNPHAGENGIVGSEEKEILTPAIKRFRRRSIKIEGPLVPDVAFFAENWNRFSVFICPLHDQGLIPFKMVHGQDSGVHITLGLPFVRTSVDHGTAKNIFGQNKANASSMLESLQWAIKLAKIKNSR